MSLSCDDMKERLDVIIAEEASYEEVLNDLSGMRRNESIAKEFGRTLKFNYVECKSKEIFLNALKNELDVEALGIEFPAEDELKQCKITAKNLQEDNNELEAKILQQIEQINEYKKMLRRIDAAKEKKVPAHQTKIVSQKEAFSSDENTPPNKYQAMVQWYENIISSIQVLSGIHIKEYLQKEEELILVVNLKFSITRIATHKAQKDHLLHISFDVETEKLLGAKLEPSSVSIQDIIARSVKLDNVKFLIREVRAKLIHGSSE